MKHATGMGLKRSLNVTLKSWWLLILLMSGWLTAAEAAARQAVLLDFDWKFRPGEVGQDYREAAVTDHWQTVQLPHDASIYGDFTRQGSDSANGWRARGAGVYQKRFVLDEANRDQRVFVEFQGVYRDARVWINGHPVAHQLNGYLGFEVDLTPYARFGRNNTLVVSYDNRKRGTSRWYTGEGIYRDVWLRVLDPVHVPLYGTHIVTPEVSCERAIVTCHTEVRNTLEQTVLCRLITEIHDPDGQIVATATAVAPIVAGEAYTFQQDMDVIEPRLWDLEQPNLYTVVSGVHHGEDLVDVYHTRFGIRSIRMTPDHGLLLNGKKVVARGGNLHHDLGCLGSAALKAGYERHIEQLKAIGCNSFRLSHNPHAPVLLDVCDEKGILIFNEAYDKWTSQFYGGEKSFESQWPADLSAFIRRDRNHPSVYIWSMGNEVLKQQGRYEARYETPEAGADYGVGLLERMRALTHQLDPSRKVTTGLFPAREKFIKEWEHWDDYDTFANSLPAEMAFHMDVVSWNYTENMFAQDHKNFPQLMFIASETGTNLLFGNRRPSWLEMDTEYVIGHYYWSAYDYLGESAWPKKSWGRSLIDLSGWITPIGRYYQSFYSQQPMVHIMVREKDAAQIQRFDAIDNKRWDWYPMVDHWNWQGRDKVRLTTFTNCDEVELILNGQSLGTQKLADGVDSRLDWTLDYLPGEIKAEARNRGEVVAEHSLQTAGTPDRIRLQPHKRTLKADGLDLAYIDAALVDAQGRLVPESGREIRFSVEGAGSNAGVANGHVISDEPWQSDQRETWYGRCQLVVRAGTGPGPIRVSAYAVNLPACHIVLVSERDLHERDSESGIVDN